MEGITVRSFRNAVYEICSKIAKKKDRRKILIQKNIQLIP